MAVGESCTDENKRGDSLRLPDAIGDTGCNSKLDSSSRQYTAESCHRQVVDDGLDDDHPLGRSIAVTSEPVVKVPLASLLQLRLISQTLALISSAVKHGECVDRFALFMSCGDHCFLRCFMTNLFVSLFEASRNNKILRAVGTADPKRYSFKLQQIISWFCIPYIMLLVVGNASAVQFANSADFANDILHVGSTKTFTLIRMPGESEISWYSGPNCDRKVFVSSEGPNIAGLITNCSSRPNLGHCVLGYQKVSFSDSGYQCFSDGKASRDVVVALQVIGDLAMTCNASSKTATDETEGLDLGTFNMSGLLTIERIVLITDSKSIPCNFTELERMKTKNLNKEEMPTVVEFKCVMQHSLRWNVSISFNSPSTAEKIVATNRPCAGFAVCRKLGLLGESNSTFAGNLMFILIPLATAVLVVVVVVVVTIVIYCRRNKQRSNCCGNIQPDASQIPLNLHQNGNVRPV